MLRAVIFDMDDTLIDWSEREGDWIVNNRECMRPIHDYLTSKGQPVPDLDALTELYHEHLRAAWDKVCPPEWHCPKQINVLESALRAAGVDLSETKIEELQRMYGWRVIPGVRVFEDTVHVLKTLHEAGLKLGLVTNADMPMWMRDKELETLEILEYIDVRLTAGDVGRLKPHPEPFEHAIKLLKVLPEEAVFVGDRLQDDVVGARTVGMRAVWIRRHNSTWPDLHPGAEHYKPNAIIQNLSELLTTFDTWYPMWRTGVAKHA